MIIDRKCEQTLSGKVLFDILQTPTINRIDLNVTLFDRVKFMASNFFSVLPFIYGIENMLSLHIKLSLNVFSLHISVTNDVFFVSFSSHSSTFFSMVHSSFFSLQ